MTSDDEVDRTEKLLVDASFAGTFREAARLKQRSLHVVLESVENSADQATVLTCIATWRKAFGNRVTVRLGDRSAKALGAGFRGCTFYEACVLVGAEEKPSVPDAVVWVGDSRPTVIGSAANLWAVNDGWLATVDDHRPTQALRESHPFVGVATGALAISELFQSLLLGNQVATNRRVVRDLWRPHAHDGGPTGPSPWDVALPDEVWIIGLGHLGQGYLWSLLHLADGMAIPSEVLVQDDDTATGSNVSTGLLTTPAHVGRRKTRVAAEQLERCSIDVGIIDRRIESSARRQLGDPAVALLGVDNYDTRRSISNHGFPLAIDVALGGRPHNFDSLTLRCFPESGNSAEVPAWASMPLADVSVPESLYEDLDLDACGALRLAGKAVGAAFVGAFSGALVWSEVARRSIGEPAYCRVDVSLRSGLPSTSRPVAPVAPPRWPIAQPRQW